MNLPFSCQKIFFLNSEDGSFHSLFTLGSSQVYITVLELTASGEEYISGDTRNAEPRASDPERQCDRAEESQVHSRPRFLSAVWSPSLLSQSPSFLIFENRKGPLLELWKLQKANVKFLHRMHSIQRRHHSVSTCRPRAAHFLANNILINVKADMSAKANLTDLLLTAHELAQHSHDLPTGKLTHFFLFGWFCLSYLFFTVSALEKGSTYFFFS